MFIRRICSSVLEGGELEEEEKETETGAEDEEKTGTDTRSTGRQGNKYGSALVESCGGCWM